MVYKDETLDRVQAIKRINDETERKQAETKLEDDIRNGETYWRQIKDQLQTLINERKELITNSDFYPRHYASKLTNMEVNIEKVDDYIEHNPLKKNTDIAKMIDEEWNKVSEFNKLKVKTEKMFERLKDYEKTLTSKEKTQNYYRKKQELSFSLLNGDLENAKKLLKYFRGKVK